MRKKVCTCFQIPEKGLERLEASLSRKSDDRIAVHLARELIHKFMGVVREAGPGEHSIGVEMYVMTPEEVEQSEASKIPGSTRRYNDD